MKFTLHVWRQKNAATKGDFVKYDARDISPDMSFLEMLDVINEELILKGDSLSPLITTVARGSAACAG